MQGRASASIKVRLVTSAVVLISSALILFCSDLLFSTPASIRIFLFILLICSSLSLLWTVHALIMLPLECLRAYAGKVVTDDAVACPNMMMPVEFHGLREALCGMVDHLKESTAAARTKEDQAERNAAETLHALSESKQKAEEVHSLLESMRGASTKAKESAARIFEAVKELNSNMEKVDNGVLVQRERLDSTALSMEQMNEAVLDIARNTGGAAQSAERSKSYAEAGAKGVREAVASIDRVKGRILGLKETMTLLGTQAQDIGHVLGVISDIADQTNLLALNVAIEAARAGDAGRGFAVVADEVRKLAEKTMTATKQVNDSVHSIQDRARENVIAVDTAAGDIVESSRIAEQSGRAMQEIVTIVENTAMEVASIAAASEEQSATSEEINRAVSEVTQVARETAENVEQSTRVVVEISGLTEELDSIIQGMSIGKLSAVSSSDRLMDWSEELSVGIRLIDDQHKVLLDLINELHAAMRARKSDAVLVGVVERLKEYTVKHFGHEEELFARYGYPDESAHKDIHRKLVQKVLDFEEQLKSGKAKVTMDIMRFLKDWLITHIQGTDKRYAPFLNSKGVY